MGDTYSASVIVTLLDGTILFEIENTVCRSLTPIKDSLVIEYPTNEIFNCYNQSIESLIPSSSTQFELFFKHTDVLTKQLKLTTNSIYKNFITRSFLSNINSRCLEITLPLILSTNIDQLKQKYCYNMKHERLFVFVFESIKQYMSDDDNEDINTTLKLLEQWNQSNVNNYLVLSKSTRIISKLLFPLENEDSIIDTPQSLFENGLMDEFYKHPSLNYQHQLIGDIIQECIKPIINEKTIFRILEFGGGTCSLSTIVLDKINQLLEQFPSHEIDIEYTWSDISPSFIPAAKDNLTSILKCGSLKNSGVNTINIIYKTLDLDQPLINDKQQLAPSHYDVIVLSNVLHVIKEVKNGLIQLYDLLLPNGQLLFIEPTYKSIHNDSIFGVFDQWWGFADTDIRKDRCTMGQDQWRNLLTDCNFENITMTNDIPDITICFLMQAQKPSFNSLISSKSPQKSSNYTENIIIYTNNNDHLKTDVNLIGCNIGYTCISNIQEFRNLIESSIINNQSIIYFTKSLDPQNLDNFKSISFEYIQINQMLLEYKLNNCKHVLLSLDSSGSNYLASSIKGSFIYFCELSKLKLYSLSLDSISINNNLPAIINYLILNPIKTTIQYEFIIKNNKVYYERYKQELKLKHSFKSSSFEIGIGSVDENENILATLTPNLEYQLDSKQLSIGEDEVEVKVIATGINYKDYLVYACLVPPIIINRQSDITKPELGHDFSGIITRVGGVAENQFKIGDQVYGIGYNTTASHIVVDKKQIYYKPSNISHCEAASLPSIYLTNIYGIFNVGGLCIKENESILIHSAAGGIGLSALEILKWKSHKAPIFATVSSKEKEQYLLDNYGDMITGIYSTNYINYSDKIKDKLNEIGWMKQGVDLILNTLSSEFMDSNFKCLATKGRIVDLSITHLNFNEFTCNNKFKYNLGYHNIELMFVHKSIISKLLKKLSIAIESGKLKLIPITQFSNSNIKEAIEYINQRKHIGKIIINHDVNVVKELIIKQSSLSNYSVLKSNYQINGLGSNIIITGQSGTAFEVLKWVVTYGSHCIENIIILSKSSLKWELEFLINKTIKKLNNKIKFHFKSVDVSNSELMNGAIDQILSDNPSITNIESILHYAFTQIACKPNKIDMHHLNVSHGAKTMGAINLHNQSIKRGWELLNFIMASSVASIFGSEDQCGYVSSCNVLDNLSKYRKSIGLPSTCINYGHIESTGFVARNESIAAMLIDAEGLNPISMNKILGSLDLNIQNRQKSTNLMISSFNFKNIKYMNQSDYHLRTPLCLKFDYQINSVVSDNFRNDQSSLDGNIRRGDLFLNKISELLSIDIPKININIKLSEYGADSLFIVQLKNWVDKEISSNIISIQQLQTNSIDETIQIINTHKK